MRHEFFYKFPSPSNSKQKTDIQKKSSYQIRALFPVDSTLVSQDTCTRLHLTLYMPRDHPPLLGQQFPTNRNLSMKDGILLVFEVKKMHYYYGVYF